MEFFAGVITTIIVGLIIYKIDRIRERRKARRAYIPPSGPTPRDYPGTKHPDIR